MLPRLKALQHFLQPGIKDEDSGTLLSVVFNLSFGLAELILSQWKDLTLNMSFFIVLTTT